MPRSIHLRQQKPNPPRETVPLMACADLKAGGTVQRNYAGKHNRHGTQTQYPVKSLGTPKKQLFFPPYC
jgi:hypothetical protein